MVKFQGCRIHIIRYLGDTLAPSSPSSILIETPLAREAGQENELSIAPISLTDSKFDQLRLCTNLKQGMLKGEVSLYC